MTERRAARGYVRNIFHRSKILRSRPGQWVFPQYFFKVKDIDTDSENRALLNRYSLIYALRLGPGEKRKSECEKKFTEAERSPWNPLVLGRLWLRWHTVKSCVSVFQKRQNWLGESGAVCRLDLLVPLFPRARGRYARCLRRECHPGR